MKNSSKDDIVVTGAGLITSLGAGVEKNLEAVKAKRTGIGFHPSPTMPSRLCWQGRVPDVEFPSWLDRGHRAQFKYLNRGARLGLVAAGEAVANSQMEASRIAPERRGLFVATGDFTQEGCGFFMPAISQARKNRNDNSPGFAEELNVAALTEPSPFYLLTSMHNNPFSFISAAFDLRGDNAVFASHSPWGLRALIRAAESLEEDRTDMALVVACGSWVCDVVIYELEKQGLLSQCRDGAASYRPFDRNRDGMLCGEGGTALILEKRKTAMDRGVKPLAKFCGAGGAQILPGRPSSISIEKSMEMAADSAGRDRQPLCAAVLSGYGTAEGDRQELTAAASFLKNQASETPVCGLRPYSGHMGAASDLADIVISLSSIRNGFIPATLNHSLAEKEFDFLRISGEHLPVAEHTDLFLATSYGLTNHAGSAFFSVEGG